MDVAASSRSALSVRDVRKEFTGTQALGGVSLEISPGEIHALAGGNGCGKSTLMKILAGVLPADSGSAEIGGTSFDLRNFSPALARRSGLHFVHQETSTFGDMTVAENLAIGRGFETDAVGRVRWRAVKRRVQAVLDRFEIEARPDDLLEDLRPASRTMVAIARALQDQEDSQSGVLALDEPTASLPPEEVAIVLGALRRYASRGQSIVFISHRLEEVLSVADRISVLRDGLHVATVPRSEISHDRLVELIVGGAVEAIDTSRVRPEHTGGPVLEVKGLGGGPLVGVDLTVDAGEILGIAGLNGSGRSSLLQMLFGVHRPSAGEVLFQGEALRLERPREAIDAGIAYVPEDRGSSALFSDLSVAENLTAGFTRDFAPRGHLHHRKEKKYAAEAMQRFLIRAASPDAEVKTLSGGNQQKIVIARWLRKRPRLLLLDEPTHGVDVGARAELSLLIREAAGEGTAVLVVSSDFDELVELCDRIVILRDGAIAGEVSGSELSVDRLNHLMHVQRNPA